jgi:uncharacterized repeat protein (TIGR03803 family)
MRYTRKASSLPRLTALAAILATAVVTGAPTYQTLSTFTDTQDLGSSYLTQATNGLFYGVGDATRESLRGPVLFALHPNGTLQSFMNPNLPGLQGVIQASDGFLYGTSSSWAPYSNSPSLPSGALFRIGLDGSGLATIYAFSFGDGNPRGAPVEGPDGHLYGVTHTPAPDTTVARAFFYRVTKSGVFTRLHNFMLPPGNFKNQPSGAPILANDGNFYGLTAWGGGGPDCGELYRMTPGGQYTKLYGFPTYAGSCAGQGFRLVQATDGYFYIPTFYGPGAFGPGPGTILRIGLNGSVSYFHTFGGSEGSRPISPIVQGDDGHLYGFAQQTLDDVTSTTLYQVTLGGQVTLVQGGMSIAWDRTAGLSKGSDGNLYATQRITHASTAFVRLTVPPVPPAFITHPASTSVTAGNPISFTAAATGTPAPAYQWQISTDGGGSWSDLQNSTIFSGTTTGTLVLASAVNALDGARFRAVATNSGGNATSNAGTLTVSRVPEPYMAVDTPFHGDTVATTFPISGWALDRGASAGTGVDTLHIWAFPVGSSIGSFVAVPAYGSARSDIGGALGAQFTNSGFSTTATLPAGQWDLLVYSHSTVTGAFSQVIAHRITVAAPTPQPATFIDTPATGSTHVRSQPMTISGWAIDRASTSGPGVDVIHIWAFPANGVFGQGGVFLSVGTYGHSRTDVGAAYGSTRFNNSGYSATVPGNTIPSTGSWDIVVFGHSTVSGAFTNAVVTRVTFQ